MIHTPSILVVQVRQSLSDFAVLIAILITVGIDVAIGIPTPKLEVPEQFKVGLSGSHRPKLLAGKQSLRVYTPTRQLFF